MIKLGHIIIIALSFFVLESPSQIQFEYDYIPEDIDSLILQYSDPGYEFLREGNYDSAEYYLLKVLELQEGVYGDMHNETARTHANLGLMFRNLNDFQKALFHINIAEKYFVENEPNSEFLGYVYNNKGNVYYNFSDFREAELYYRYCLDFFETNNQVQTDAYAHAYINLFNILIIQDRNAEADTLLDELKEEYVDQAVAFRRHIFLAESYNKLGKYEIALKEASIAEGIYDLSFKPNIPMEIMVNHTFALIEINKGDYNNAIVRLMRNITIIDGEAQIFFDDLLNTYLLIGNIHFLKGKYEECISWLSNSIKKLSLDEFQSDPSKSILNERSFNNQLIDFYRLYGNAAEKLAIETAEIKYLEIALNNFTRSIEYLKVFRLHMRNEESIRLESKTRLSLVHEAVNVAARLYNLTGRKEYLVKAFEYAENMKSFSLYSVIKGVEAMQFADLPENTRNREALLTQRIKAYSELIYDESKSESPNLDLIRIYESSFFKLKDDYNSLLDSIELNYPKYFSLKYNPNFITPEEVQKKLDRKMAVVEYVLSDSVLTTFVIDKEQIKVLLQQVDPSFSQSCLDYFNLLQNQDFNRNVHETYRDFVTMGKRFYEILVEPVLEITKCREITFVPDGAIMYLPFESFVTDDVDKEYINYHDLPYLIYDVAVGYSYSSTLLFNDRIKSKSPDNRVLAFAPEYANLMGSDSLMEWNRQANPDFLMPLPGAEDEVKYIAKLVPTKLFLEYEASERNFKETASDYSVLHLAMHTIMNDENPMYSKLAFARNFSDTTEDHDLFTYEIYNMKLNAEMVVLSSCSSGYGRMQKGEGMMSMARGFIYAGCPSIVMTLWQVSDQSSSELMGSFYKYLKKGKNKKSALRQAKMDYIQSADKLKSNPYFWSAFMMVGDNSPLYKSSPIVYLSIIILGFILLVLVFTFQKQLKSFIKGRS